MVHRRRQAPEGTAPLMAVLASLMLLCPRAAFALDPSLDISQYAHTAWTSRDGVVRGAVGSIAQTPDGYLWIGTDQGLVRFDGVRTVPVLPGQQLPSDGLNRLLVARDGALWIGTDKGLVRWKDGKFERFPQVVASSVYPLVEDKAGTLWIGTDGPAGVCAARAGRIDCQRDERLGRSGIEALEDGSGKLWFGTRTGVWRWLPGPPERFPFPTGIYDAKGLVEDGNGGLLLATNVGVKRFVDGKIESQPGLEAARRPLTFLRSRDGSLWIGGFNGLCHLHQGRIDVFGRDDGLSGQVVNRLYEDREGSVWVGTSSGLDRFREFTFPILSPDQGLSSSLTWAVQASRDGSVWIAASNGLNRWQDGRVTFYGTRPPSPPGKHTEGVRTVPLLESAVRSMALDDQDRLWVGLRQGIFRIEDERLVQIPGLPGKQVLAIAPAGHDEIWVSVAEAGLFHWTASDPVQNFSWAFFGQDDWSAALLPDPARHGLWIGFRSASGQVARLEDGRVADRWGTAEGLGAGHVNHLRFGDRGAVWAATEGGLSRIADGKVRTLTTRQGLPCDAVSWSIEDDDHATWLYTGCGLVHVTRSELDAWVEDPARTLRTTVFDGSDGVMKVGTYAGFFGPSVAKDPDGKIWFTHDDGVTRIDPRHLPYNTLPPPVHIEQITADGKGYDATARPLRLPPRVRDLSIDYTALSLVAPEKVRFRVKLEGQDSDWRELVNERHVRYTNLPPRSYRFRVKASNNSGVWTEQDAFLDFVIPPAWFQAAWFRVLCVAALGSLLWAAHRVRLGVVVRHQRLLERHQTEVEAQAKEVRALSGEVRRQVAERARNLAASLMQLPDSPSSGPRIVAGDLIDGRYRILRPLGQGGMGVVYEVERLHDGRRLALKLMLGMAQRADLARFAREAQVAAQLDHANVVATLDVGVTDTGALFLVMELVRGNTLQAERARYGDVAWAVPILVQVARALAVMHGEGIVHRDLKPSNVMLEGALVKVGDFGIAALLDDEPGVPGLTRSGVLAGTPPYMAPELAGGIREATPAADIFSLGVLCFEVLARRFPHSVPPVLEAQFGHSPSAPEQVEHAAPTVPKPLAHLIDACLQVDPASRPTARAAMATLESVSSELMPQASVMTTEDVSTSERQTLAFGPTLKNG